MGENVNYKWKLPISFYLTLFAFVFSISGYIYARTYYREFGVKVERFFALEDYLRNSIDRIYILVLAIGIWLFMFIFVLKVIKIFRDKDTVEEKEKKKGNVIKYINLFLLLLICALMVILYISGERYIVYMSTIAGIYGGLYKLAEFRGFWGFNEVEWIIMTILTYFIIMVFLYAGVDAGLMKYGKKSIENDKYEFMMNEEKDLKHIGSTSQFMFMYNEKENYTLVVPISSLKRVKVVK